MEELQKKIQELEAELEKEKSDKTKILKEKKDLLELYNKDKSQIEEDRKKLEELEKQKENMTDTEKMLFDRNLALEKELNSIKDRVTSSAEAETNKAISDLVGNDEAKQITIKNHLNSISKIEEYSNKDLNTRLDIAFKLSGLEKKANPVTVNGNNGTDTEPKTPNFVETEKGKAAAQVIFPNISKNNNQQ